MVRFGLIMPGGCTGGKVGKKNNLLIPKVLCRGQTPESTGQVL